jgi:hypothetical protein
MICECLPRFVALWRSECQIVAWEWWVWHAELSQEGSFRRVEPEITGF